MVIHCQKLQRKFKDCEESSTVVRISWFGMLFAALVIFAGYANAKPSCQSLKTMKANLDTFANAVGETGSTNLDGKLWDLVVDARYLASVENDKLVMVALDDMVSAWNGKDQDLYVRSSDNLAGRLEFFLNRDC